MKTSVFYVNLESIKKMKQWKVWCRRSDFLHFQRLSLSFLGFLSLSRSIVCVKRRLPKDLLSGYRAEIWLSQSHIAVARAYVTIMQRVRQVWSSSRASGEVLSCDTACFIKQGFWKWTCKYVPLTLGFCVLQENGNKPSSDVAEIICLLKFSDYTHAIAFTQLKQTFTKGKQRWQE